MRSRGFRIFLFALVAVWYAAVLPGHQRGIVQMPGAGGGDPCCERGKPHRPGEPTQPPTGSPLTCAVCHYMGALSSAAPPDLGIAPLGPSDEQRPQLAPAPVSIRILPPYHGRAPPVA